MKMSPGVKLKDMKIQGSSVYSDVYQSGKSNNDDEHLIESIRKKLPDEVKNLGIIAYTKPFLLEGQETIQMIFETADIFPLMFNGKISYLIIQSDSNYDVECTTHWYTTPPIVGGWNPFSIFDPIIDFFAGLLKVL